MSLRLHPDTWLWCQTIKRKGDAVEAMEGRLNLQGSVKTTKWKLTWLPCIPDLVPLTLVFFGHLITKKKLEEDDNFEDLVNHASVSSRDLLLPWPAGPRRA